MLPKIATPKYDMIVPSTGKSITYRPYVVKEEKILLIALESEDEKQIEKSIYSMIESCLDGKVNINDFTNFDIEFIFLTLRSMSVGEGIKLNIPCSSCEEPNEVSVDLNKLEVKNNDFDKKDLQIKINDDITIDLRWPTMSDRAVEITSGTEAVIHMVAKSIGTLYHGEDIISMSDTPFSEVLEFVESLSSAQFNQCMQVLVKTPYTGYDIKFTCKKCGHKNERELKGMADFFQ
jgi:hypothetical protein|tara:strand:+ start:699 stop:1400 length:702 start_codon:yes stop_codon:yes gene_type:complete